MEEESINVGIVMPWENQGDDNPITQHIKQTMGLQVYTPDKILPKLDYGKLPPFLQPGKTIKITKWWYINYGKYSICIRLFGYQFYAKRDEIEPLYSERIGVIKYKRIGKWRFNFGKLK